MLEEKDLQAIGDLLDKKLDKVLGVINQGFNDTQEQISALPTTDKIFSWADKNLVDLKVRVNRLDYLHLNELSTLPPKMEIKNALIEHEAKMKAM